MQRVLMHWWTEREEQERGDESTGQDDAEEVEAGEGRGRSAGDFKEARILMATTEHLKPSPQR